jgi:hypothetical protein
MSILTGVEAFPPGRNFLSQLIHADRQERKEMIFVVATLRALRALGETSPFFASLTIYRPIWMIIKERIASPVWTI